MPHPTPTPLDRILSSLPAGAPRRDHFGLTIVPLPIPVIPARSPPRLVYTELGSPTPDALLASNRSGDPAIIHLGAVIGGGMADRAVTATITVAPSATELVPVEPLAAGWWRRGEPDTSAHLPAPLLALLILATRADPGLRSIARSALWEAYRRPSDRSTDPLMGWLLTHDRAVLAVHLVGRRAESGWTVSAHQAVAGLAGRAVVSALHRYGGLVDLHLVRASPELPDAVVTSLLG